jgi:transaldolase
MTTKNKQVQALNELGQSVWYDNLSRDVLQSGELVRLIGAGVSGLTSNPTIFDKAISGSALYDDSMRPLVKKGESVAMIIEELMVSDVGQAADLLRETYRTTNAGDGYASIEVSPLLARNTQDTIEEGKRLWKKLNRPNIMIKVPATNEGLPAITALLAEGINVNVTLIFSVEVYAKVVEAFMQGLEARVANGGSIKDLSSVASFFVSRVDSIVEKKFDAAVATGKVSADKRSIIEAKVGIANSKLAYAKYEELFKSDRFKKLAAQGARVQRPLWASTGTKNPKFSPVLYVEELAGRDTVNTMPPQTVEALMKNAVIEPRLHKGAKEARTLIEDLSALGVDFQQCLQELQEQGVQLFADSYRSLSGSVEKKCKEL